MYFLAAWKAQDEVFELRPLPSLGWRSAFGGLWSLGSWFANPFSEMPPLGCKDGGVVLQGAFKGAVFLCRSSIQKAMKTLSVCGVHYGPVPGGVEDGELML